MKKLDMIYQKLLDIELLLQVQEKDKALSEIAEKQRELDMQAEYFKDRDLYRYREDQLKRYLDDFKDEEKTMEGTNVNR